MKNNNERRNGLLTLTEVSQLLNVHPNTLRRWSKDGRIKSYRIGPRGDRRFKQEEIDRFLAEYNNDGDIEQKAIINDKDSS